MRWTVEEGTPYITVRTEGEFDTDDHRAMVVDILAQPFWRPGRDVLFDHRALSFSDSDYTTMAMAVQNHRTFDPQIGNGRAAVLMASPADFGLARIFDALAADTVHADLRVFLNEGEARSWLSEPRLAG